MEDLWRAVERARELRSRRVLSSAHERRLFALFKQATQGPHALSEEASSIPAFYETEAREKLAAWQALGSMPPEEARRLYVVQVESLGGSLGTSSPATSPLAAPPSPFAPTPGNPAMIPLSATQPALAALVRDLASDEAVLGVALQRQEQLLKAVRDKLTSLRAPAPPSSAPTEAFAILTSKAQDLERLMQERALEERMRSLHARRSLAEEMLASKLEALEERIAALERTQKSVAAMSRLGPLAHPYFPLTVAALVFGSGLGLLLLVLIRRRLTPR